MMRSGTSTFSFFLALPFLLCVGVAESSVGGPCRKWYKPCPTTGVNVGWVCTSVEAYQRYHSRGGCFYPNNDQSAATIPPAPPERCLFVDDTCQFSDSTLQCAFHQSWADGCQYRCVQVNGSSWTNGSENCRFQIANGLPPPDELCLPINGECGSYNPCKYWKGFCSGPYHCGTLEQYYRFRFGPQPLCARPPKGFVPHIPPGDCLLTNNRCSWSDCERYIDFCKTYWLCGTAYDAAVYKAGPPPPCPAPPPGYTPPPPPGECLFNRTQHSCTFQDGPRYKYDACSQGDLVCDTPTFKCVGVGRFPLSASSVCLRQCSQANGGCNTGQICVERPLCKDCNASDIIEGTCLNSRSVSCPSDIRLKCLEGTNQCAMDKETGGFSCVGSCLKNNGGCDNKSVCISEVRSGCDPSTETCQFLTKCIPLKDLSEDASCPIGQEESQSGRCSLGCEDYQSDEPTSSSATCSGCVCPVGLVRYRDRCVDPKTCYSLFMNPPPFNPIPLTDHQVLVAMKMMTVRSNFVRGQRNFVNSVQVYLNRSGKFNINVTLHGYTGDVPLQVALLLSGGGVSKGRASGLAGLVQSGSGNFSFAIVDVTVLESTRVGDDDDDGSFRLVTAVPEIVFVLSVVTVLLVVIIIVCGVVRTRRRPRVTKQTTSDQVAVISQSGDVLSGQNGFKYSELYGSEDIMLEPLEDKNFPDDNKLSDDKKLPE